MLENVLRNNINNTNQLWGENFDRRVFHHIANSDYKPHRTPYVEKISTSEHINSLDQLRSVNFENINSLQTMSPLLSSLAGGYYTTLSPIYKHQFTEEQSSLIITILNQYKPYISKLNKKLKLNKGSNLSYFINRYQGSDSEFKWHYDRDYDNVYKLIILVDGTGEFAPFKYIDKYEKEITIKLEIGDAVLMKGSTTFHCIPKTADPESYRMSLIFQLIPEDIDYLENPKTICNQVFNTQSVFKLHENVFENWKCIWNSTKDTKLHEYIKTLKSPNNYQSDIDYILTKISFSSLFHFYLFLKYNYFLSHDDTIKYIIHIIETD